MNADTLTHEELKANWHSLVAEDGTPTETFWALWKEDKEGMKALGVVVEKDFRDTFTVCVPDEEEGWIFLTSGFRYRAEKKKIHAKTESWALLKEHGVVEYHSRGEAEDCAAKMNGRVITVEFGRSLFLASLGKPRKRRTVQQLKWAKINSGLSDKMAEEMKVFYEEGSKPSRAPLFHYIDV